MSGLRPHDSPSSTKKLLRDFSGFDSLVFCEDNEESSHGLD